MLLVLAMTGCDQLSTGKSTAASTIVVIDLEAIAKVTGQNAVIEERMAATREEVNGTITALIADLEKRLAEAQAGLGDSPDQEAQQEFQQLTVRAQQQLAQQRGVAQQLIQEYQTGLIADFRNTVKPVAAEIATARGADAILIFDPLMLWFNSSTDITDEVIGAMRDRNISFPEANAIQTTADPVVAPAAN